MKRSTKTSRTGTFEVPLFGLKVSRGMSRAVAATVQSGWLTTGARTEEFERAVGEYLGAKACAAVSSGTAALQLALAAAGVSQGTEVVTTPFTFVATTQAILALGARPRLVDIDPATMTIDPAAVAGALNRRTAAVLPVDIGGLPCDYRKLASVVAKRRVPIVGDCAHSFGARLDGRHLPAYCRLACYSFYSTKNLTCGEGGMVVANSTRLIDRVRTLSRHGLTSSAHGRREKGGSVYDVVGQGIKANMSDVHATIGLASLKEFDANQRRRRRLAERYRTALTGLREFMELPETPDGFESSWHLFILRLRPRALRIGRDELIEKMARRGVQCGVHFRPVFTLSHYRRILGLRARDYPHAARAGRTVVSLPLYPHLSRSQQEQVISSLESLCRRFRR